MHLRTTLWSAEATLLGTLLCMFGGQKCDLNCFVHVTFKIIENLFYVRNARLIMGRIICLRFIRKNAFPT